MFPKPRHVSPVTEQLHDIIMSSYNPRTEISDWKAIHCRDHPSDCEVNI